MLISLVGFGIVSHALAQDELNHVIDRQNGLVAAA